MSTSIVSSRRIVQSARLPDWKATACGLLAHLALIIVVLAPSVAAAASLGLDASWPGQADTEIGMLPAPTQNALCVSDAYPTLAAGFLAGPAPFTGHMLHLATTDNYGVWPESGNLDEANQIPIQGFLVGATAIGAGNIADCVFMRSRSMKARRPYTRQRRLTSA